MTIQFSVATSPQTTETPQILANRTGRMRGTTAISDAIAQILPMVTGRDRSPDFVAIGSDTTAIALPIRIRRAIAESPSVTSGELSLVAVSPSLRVPTSELFVGGERFKGGAWPKNKSHYLDFLVVGDRLQYLETTFKLTTLEGRIKTYKTSLADGVILEDIETTLDGLQQRRGFVLLKPSDTNFTETGSIEFKYRFCIGNKSTREHLLEEGFVTLY